jgi:hypothetical protein
MVCFNTKNPNFGIFWRALEGKMLVYFATVCSNLCPFGIHNILPFGIVCGHFGRFLQTHLHSNPARLAPEKYFKILSVIESDLSSSA